MYMEKGYLEILEKARTIRTGPGIISEKFTKHEQGKIIKLLEKLWDRQFDLMTRNRVLSALQVADIPKGFMNDLEGVTRKWMEKELLPALQNAILYAAEGGGQVVGMMGAINEAVGAKILFSPSTKRITDWLEKNGAQLVVDITETQRGALKTMLQESIKKSRGVNETYELMRQSITLTNRESEWLSNFYQRVYEDAKEEIPLSVPKLSKEELEKRATNTAKRLAARRKRLYQRNRAYRISVTELKRAKTFGDIEAHKQALDAGIISSALKEWNRLKGGKPVRDWESSKMYDGKRIPIDENFSQFGIPGKTTMLDYDGPGEIHERCYLVFYVEPGENIGGG